MINNLYLLTRPILLRFVNGLINGSSSSSSSSSDMTLPVHRKRKDAGRQQLQKVAERRRLHRPVRSTYPAYDVTCQLTQFRRIAEFPVFRGDDSWRYWFRHGHTPSRAFHYLYVHKCRGYWHKIRLEYRIRLRNIAPCPDENAIYQKSHVAQSCYNVI